MTKVGSGILFVFLYTAFVGASDLAEVKLSTENPIPQSRNVILNKFEGAKKTLSLLERVKQAEFDRDWSQCVQLSSSASHQHPQIADWITLTELRCYKRIENLTQDQIKNLLKLVQSTFKNANWFVSSPAAKDLKPAILEARFQLVEATTKRNPQEAWGRVEELLQLLDWMDTDQKATALKMAGELAFIRQNLMAAKRFFERSLVAKDDEKVRGRLSSVDIALKVSSAKKEENQDATSKKDDTLEASEKEREIVERMRTALKSGDLLAAVEDGIDLLEDYPWGARANWAADRIWEAYEQIVKKNDPNFLNLRGKILKQMLKADSKRLSDWASNAFRLSQFSDCYDLSEQSIKRAEEQYNTTSIRVLLARAAQAMGKDREARKQYMHLVERHAGTPEARQALFQVGLLSYKLGENTVAAASLERLLVLPGADDMELDIRYWLWRSLNEVDKARAKAEVDVILQKFPFSYYGLRVRAETNQGVIELPMTQQKNKLSATLWMTTQEKNTWNRFQELSKAGWYPEAQAELELIPQPKDPVAMALMAQAWAAAFGFSRSIGLMGKAWDQDSRLRGMPFFGLVLPKEFSKQIQDQAKKNNLDPDWIRGLIRQESAFNFTARSKSNAYGLMQMIPPTAEEVAADIGWKNLKLPDDLYDPATNLKFCSYYLAKVLGQFGGHLPLALASYNAGPKRIGDWYQARGLQMTLTSEPKQEIWIDELPWNEPRYYVKAILRNIILYRVLDKGRVQISDPIWK
jgi:soluble lytic murein transglycosylase